MNQNHSSQPINLSRPQPERLSLLDFSKDDLVQYVGSLGEPSYRADQIWEWVYKRYATRFAEMTNLPKALRERLEAEATVAPLAEEACVVSADGETQKALLRLPDGQTIEAVLMLYDRRRTLCISSQVGCAMGCTFCATALGGLARNLTAGEITAQALYFARYLGDPELEPPASVSRPTSVTNIVLMGMGEPMHNYKNVWEAIRRLTDASAFGLGARHITLSTVGLAPMIDRMAEENLQVNLAVSLHAPNDELRNELVPINRRYPIDDLLASVRRYVARTNRRVTFEYVLIRGVNDSLALAEELGRRLHSLLCHVNVIPWNPVPGSEFEPTGHHETEQFVQVLLDHGVPATVRIRRGIEISAGCGQLRRQYAEASIQAPEA
jgi:23S rRNA (adenine2503-C2)-methyltransferase